MHERDRGKAELLAQIEKLRARVAELDRSEDKRKRAEEALGEREQLFRFLVQNAFDGINICEFDPVALKRRLLFCNDRYVEMSGHSREELAGADDLNELVTQHHSEAELAHHYDCIVKGVPFAGTASWKRADGKENTYEWSGVSVERGDKYHIIGVDRDITERRRAEGALRKLNEELERRVAERTAELRRTVKLLAGREVRMAELKEAIRQMRAQLESAGLTPVAQDPLSREEHGSAENGK